MYRYFCFIKRRFSPESRRNWSPSLPTSILVMPSRLNSGWTEENLPRIAGNLSTSLISPPSPSGPITLPRVSVFDRANLDQPSNIQLRRNIGRKGTWGVGLGHTLADFPALFFHISHWYLSWNTAGGCDCI